MIPIQAARERAHALQALFMPFCTRVQGAGSIRRGSKTEVKDIEIVAEPRLERDLFGGDSERPTALDHLVDGMVKEGAFRKRMNVRCNPQAYGPRYKALVDGDMALDLFIVRPPANFYVALVIRTGPAEFSKMLVTQCRRVGIKCEDMRLVYENHPTYRDGTVVDIVNEESVISQCGLSARYKEVGARDSL